MTFTDRLKAAAERALESRREELDADLTLRSVTLVINVRRGVLETLFRKESGG